MIAFDAISYLSDVGMRYAIWVALVVLEASDEWPIPPDRAARHTRETYDVREFRLLLITAWDHHGNKAQRW